MSDEWLKKYFDGENQIDLEKVLKGIYGQVYQDMMSPLISSAIEQQWPVLLPFSDGSLSFYAASENERMLLELRRVLMANLGSAYTNAELPIIKEASNSSEKVLLSYAPVGLIRITMLEEFLNDLEAQKEVFSTLKKVLLIYKQRPLLEEHIQRPVGRVLREFYTACQVDDGVMAYQLYEELKVSGKLSQRNILFINFQALRAERKWDAILNHEQLISCLKGRIPLQLVRLFLQAIANRHPSLLTGGFSDDSLENVRQDCQILEPIFSKVPFSSEIKGVKHEWQMWAIGAVLNGFTDIETHIPEDLESSWINELFDWAGVDRKVSGIFPETNQRKAYGEKLDIEKVKELLQYTLLATHDEVIDIIRRLSDMPTNVTKQLSGIPILHQHWINLQENYLKSDYGWTKWFTDICENGRKIEELRQLAIKECMDWSKSTFESELIQERFETVCNVEALGALRDVMPLMIEWLDDRDIQCPERFWVGLMELLALDDIASQQDVQLSGAVLERLLLTSYSKKSYSDALQAIEMLLDKVNSVLTYDAVLDLMDLLLDNPCPSQDSQQSLWLAIQSFAFKKWHRLTPLMRKLTLFTSRDVLGIGSEASFPNVVTQEEIGKDEKEKYPDLSGKILGIYSLTEGAAKRSKEILESLFSGLLIHLNHDHTATSSLKNLAEKAEYFVFAAKSAKHQAFYAVTHIRKDIIYPQGKGASSIVRAFISKIQNGGV